MNEPWTELISLRNLFDAASRAAEGKKSRPDVALFRANLEPELFRLRRQLADGSYRPGRHHTFRIADPKPRLISAAPFRDRVVHHALTNVLEPVFERRFIPWSFACRKGLGTHKALALARRACARYSCVLKLDVRKYFPSIDHRILMDLLARVVRCPDTLRLIEIIVESSHPESSHPESSHPESSHPESSYPESSYPESSYPESSYPESSYPESSHSPNDALQYFPGDTLFTPLERRRGLPLGNQTSQFFANVYLNPMDHMIVRNLRPGVYARYVDDFLLFSDSREELNEMHLRIGEFLDRYRLTLHPGKSRVYRCRDGFPFLGFRLFPTHARLARPNVMRFRRRLRQLHADYHSGLIDKATVNQSVQAWIGHAMHGDTWRLREQIFEALPFLAGVRRAV